MSNEDLASELAAEAAEAEAAEAPSREGALESLSKLGAEVNTNNAELARLAGESKKLSDRNNTILGREMVDIMDAVHLEDFSVDGVRFQVGPYVHASIPEDHRDAAHDWLEQHEAGDLIKYQVIVTMPKDSTEETRALEQMIRERYQMAEVEVKRGVPWARLTSWLKEYIKLGAERPEQDPPPLELLGAKVGRVVKFKEK